MATFAQSFDPDTRPFGDGDPTALKLWQRFEIARRYHAANRRQQRRDEDMYHNEQWDATVKQNVEASGRPALTVNLIKPTIDLVLGQEVTNRKALVGVPRGPDDLDAANAATQYLKYANNQCDGDEEVSRAYEDAVIRGEGWIEADVRHRDDLRDDLAEGLEDEPYWRWVDPEMVWVDPNCRRNDLSDARYICRATWLDIDEAIGMFPKHEEDFKRLMQDRYDLNGGIASELAGTANRTDPWEDVDEWDGDSSCVDTNRRQVLILETQYRSIEKVAMIVTDEGAVPFDRDNQEHVMLLEATPDEMLDTMFPEVPRKVMKIAMSCGPILLQDDPSTHEHNQFSLDRITAYRTRKGHAYGLVRQLVDSQVDYNKRRSTALFLLVAKRVLFESGAVRSAARLAQQIANPAAVIEVNDGALAKNRIRIERDADLAQGHVEMMHIGESEIKSVSGVNNELRGQGPSDQSGRAILARQQQGNMMLAPVMSRLSATMKRVGVKTLSLFRQYVKKPKTLRLTDAPTSKEWLELNTPTGIRVADIKVDITVEEAPATASVRQMNLENLMTFIEKMPPEISMALLPELIAASDVPDREKIKAKVEEQLMRLGVIPPPQMQPGMMPGHPVPGQPGMMPPGAPMAPAMGGG